MRKRRHLSGRWGETLICRYRPEQEWTLVGYGDIIGPLPGDSNLIYLYFTKRARICPTDVSNTEDFQPGPHRACSQPWKDPKRACVPLFDSRQGYCFADSGAMQEES